MLIANWDDFNKKNKDKTTAFENMCRVLFLRKFKKSGYDYDYDYNHPGLEFAPVFDENTKKWYGAQCKYFETFNNQSVYKEIWHSLELAEKNNKGHIDFIYVFTNANLQNNSITKNRKNSKVDKSKKEPTPREKIQSFKDEKGIDIVWMKLDNISDVLLEPSNIDIFKLYFSDTRELDFLDDSISIKDKTFINSNELLDLSLDNDLKLNSIYNELLKKKYNIILGHAGTGKTMLMKKLYVDFSTILCVDMFDKTKSVAYLQIPVFIKLRECINGNLENLVRQRLKDYNLNFTFKEYKYIYLLDGFDELPYHKR